MATATTASTCQCCGRYVGLRGRTIGVSLDGVVTAERILCQACACDALEAFADAVRRREPAAPLNLGPREL